MSFSFVRTQAKEKNEEDQDFVTSILNCGRRERHSGIVLPNLIANEFPCYGGKTSQSKHLPFVIFQGCFPSGMTLKAQKIQRFHLITSRRIRTINVCPIISASISQVLSLSGLLDLLED